MRKEKKREELQSWTWHALSVICLCHRSSKHILFLFVVCAYACACVTCFLTCIPTLTACAAICICKKNILNSDCIAIYFLIRYRKVTGYSAAMQQPECWPSSVLKAQTFAFENVRIQTEELIQAQRQKKDFVLLTRYRQRDLWKTKNESLRSHNFMSVGRMQGCTLGIQHHVEGWNLC